MAGGFDNGVSPPGGASYAAPLLNFANFSNWAADDPYQQKLEAAKLQQMQQQIELSKAFAGGLPTDAQGGIDYRKAAAILASKGDISGAVSLMQQQPAPLSPMFGGQPQGAPPQGQPQAQPQGPPPASVQARPLPPTPAGKPTGDQPGSLTDLVTDRLPDQNQTTGATIIKIAQVMGVDPNATLTPGQQRRAQGLLERYAPEIAGQSGKAGGTSFKDRFAGAEKGDLPPSANAISSAPQVSSAAPRAPQQPQQAAPQPQGGAAAQPQAQTQGGPIMPQEPLPPGFSDPTQAIRALRSEAVKYANMPNGQGVNQAREMEAWAGRIENSIKPVSVGASTTLIDPRTGKPVYQGPAAAAYSGAAEASATLDADAALYRQTGKLPPNMGRGIQGQQQATAIRSRAAQQEIDDGGDPSEWSIRWQKFGAQATGRRVLENRAAGLELAENEATTLIPRVRDASAKVSRTEYPNINALINAAKKGTGGTDVIKLGIAVESLVPVYARVLKPTGQIAQGDMARAHDILDKAWSDGQINAALDQMQVELGSARTALDKTLEEYGTKGKTERPASSAAPAAPAAPKSGSKPDADGWVTLPNGARIQEVKG